jgi:RNA chaperone Hfq
LALPPSEEEAKKKRLDMEILEARIIMVEEVKRAGKPLSNGFIPKLKGKKVVIRLVSGGQPVTGTIEGYNPYELLLQTANGQLLVFKHAIVTIEPVDEPKGSIIER